MTVLLEAEAIYMTVDCRLDGNEKRKEAFTYMAKAFITPGTEPEAAITRSLLLTVPPVPHRRPPTSVPPLLQYAGAWMPRLRVSDCARLR